MRLFCLALLISGSVQAQTLTIPVGAQGEDAHLPRFGQSRASVLERFGLPSKEHAAIGQPPISRWDYANFSVYFEHQHVVSSVAHPKQKLAQHD